jgi:hypothetical protein
MSLGVSPFGDPSRRQLNAKTIGKRITDASQSGGENAAETRMVERVWLSPFSPVVAAVLRWGTRGPEFKSRRPDWTKPRHRGFRVQELGPLVHRIGKKALRPSRGSLVADWTAAAAAVTGHRSQEHPTLTVQPIRPDQEIPSAPCHQLGGHVSRLATGLGKQHAHSLSSSAEKGLSAANYHSPSRRRLKRSRVDPRTRRREGESARLRFDG